MSEKLFKGAEIWIHPAQGGDDILTGLKFIKPLSKKEATEEVQKFLKKKNSAVTNDFRLTC